MPDLPSINYSPIFMPFAGGRNSPPVTIIAPVGSVYNASILVSLGRIDSPINAPTAALWREAKDANLRVAIVVSYESRPPVYSQATKSWVPGSSDDLATANYVGR